MSRPVVIVTGVRRGIGRAILPLGLDQECLYSHFDAPVAEGDLVLFYTDGLVEVTDQAEHGLGQAGLLEVVRSLDVSEPARIGRGLLESLNRYRGGKPFDDDLTVLTLCRNRGRPPRLHGVG